MIPVATAVIGGGHLGTIHARLLQQVDDTKLVGIVEPGPQRAAELKDEFSCPVFADVSQLLRETSVDAAILAVPTSLHHPLGSILLQQGIHTLIEKPLAPTPEACRELIVMAQGSQSILQVGHVERFNPVWTTARSLLRQPSLIEARREGRLMFRCMDVGVILDLMIHDIDLILSLVRQPLRSVETHGICWTGPSEDVAIARLTFEDDCVAILSASRIASEPRRQMTLFGEDWQAFLDFGNGAGHLVYAPDEADWQNREFTPDQRQHLIQNLFVDVLRRESLSIPSVNPILDEQRDFIDSILHNRSPQVTGYDGWAAVDVAHQIARSLHASSSSHLGQMRRAG